MEPKYNAFRRWIEHSLLIIWRIWRLMPKFAINTIIFAFASFSHRFVIDFFGFPERFACTRASWLAPAVSSAPGSKSNWQRLSKSNQAHLLRFGIWTPKTYLKHQTSEGMTGCLGLIDSAKNMHWYHWWISKTVGSVLVDAPQYTSATSKNPKANLQFRVLKKHKCHFDEAKSSMNSAAQLYLRTEK